MYSLARWINLNLSFLNPSDSLAIQYFTGAALGWFQMNPWILENIYERTKGFFGKPYQSP